MLVTENGLEVIKSARKALSALITVLFVMPIPLNLHEDNCGVIPSSLLHVILTPSEFCFRNRRASPASGSTVASTPLVSPTASGLAVDVPMAFGFPSTSFGPLIEPLVDYLAAQLLSHRAACRDAALGCLRAIAETSSMPLLEASLRL